MLGYLPPLYDNAPVFRRHLQAEGTELDPFWDGLQDIVNQFFADTATWSLEAWEEEFGFPPNPSQTTEERRSRVLGRMRGNGTLTIKLIKQVAEAYNNGQVDVMTDYPSATYVVKFVDTRGVPSNLADLQAEIKRIVPTRYTVAFEFLYMTWDQFDAKNLTWDQFDALGLTWDQFDNDGV